MSLLLLLGGAPPEDTPLAIVRSRRERAAAFMQLQDPPSAPVTPVLLRVVSEGLFVGHGGLLT